MREASWKGVIMRHFTVGTVEGQFVWRVSVVAETDKSKHASVCLKLTCLASSLKVLHGGFNTSETPRSRLSQTKLPACYGWTICTCLAALRSCSRAAEFCCHGDGINNVSIVEPRRMRNIHICSGLKSASNILLTDRLTDWSNTWSNACGVTRGHIFSRATCYSWAS